MYHHKKNVREVFDLLFIVTLEISSWASISLCCLDPVSTAWHRNRPLKTKPHYIIPYAVDQVEKSHLNKGVTQQWEEFKWFSRNGDLVQKGAWGHGRLERFGGKIIELCFKVILRLQKTTLKLPAGFRLSLCWEGNTSAVCSGASERSQPSELPAFSTAAKLWQIRRDLQRKKCHWSAVMEVIKTFLPDTQTGFPTHLKYCSFGHICLSPSKNTPVCAWAVWG